ncbi:MAG: cytochrome b6-f complex subunit 6 [Vulcanococcus sp.]|jgi:hypothetical protein
MAICSSLLPMGPVIYLALLGGGLVAAAAISFVLRGIKLI